VGDAVGPGDQRPQIHEKLLASEILVKVPPTWRRPSYVAQRVLERMDAMLSETDDDGRPVACNRVAGAVVTGKEDGTHHVISEISGALGGIGCTVPGQAWTYWHPGPGPDSTTNGDATGRTRPAGRWRPTSTARRRHWRRIRWGLRPGERPQGPVPSAPCQAVFTGVASVSGAVVLARAAEAGSPRGPMLRGRGGGQTASWITTSRADAPRPPERHRTGGGDA